MSFLIIAPEMNTDSWVKHLTRHKPDLDVRVWPDVGNPSDIEFALVWHHPPGELTQFPNLKCISSMGAGVDHLLKDDTLPEHVPVVRIVHPSMAQSMSEYVVLAVLNYCRNFDQFIKDKALRRWQKRIPRRAAKTKVGIMGLGHLGSRAAENLISIGFPVAGWRRTPKKAKGVDCYYGEAQIEAFLANANILVCMLPLNDKTTGILNAATFCRLPQGAYIINVARGEHLVEKDLLNGIDTGQLSGACLDVFQTEPLPEDHPFWDRPEIIVTPHISSLTNPKLVTPQIIENYNRTIRGGRPLHPVNKKAGY